MIDRRQSSETPAGLTTLRTGNRAAVEHTYSGGLYLRAAGDPQATRTVLWIHGLGESGLSFEGVLGDAALARWRHLAVELPGYGKSPWAPDPLSLEDEADRLAAWLDEQGVPSATVVGHSMGGVVGLLLAERHAARVDGLFNVDGNLSPGDCVFSGRAAAEDEAAFVAEGMGALLDDLYRAGATDAALRGYYVSVRLCDPRQYHRNSGELVAISRTEAIAQRLAELPLPVRYMSGVPGGACARSRTLVAAAGVTEVVIEGSGHWPFIDRPGTFVSELRAFLESLDGDE